MASGGLSGRERFGRNYTYSINYQLERLAPNLIFLLSTQVNFYRDESDPDSWFNLLVLHQNRAKHSATSYIPEHFIDGDMFDLVFWGHEHECRRVKWPEFASRNPGTAFTNLS
jgi:DNA repair exonuclease SbcCD nuclease subunit